MVRSLAAAPDGGLWIRAYPGGLKRLNTATGEIRTIDGVADGLKSENIRHIMVDRDERVWASTRDGLFRGNPDYENSSSFFHRIPSRARTFI